MSTEWLDRRQLAAWVRVASVLEVLPGVLDGQLRRDGGVTLFEYFVLAVLTEAPGGTMRMSALAQRTNATLPRLSNVVRRMESRGLLVRRRADDDARATDVGLTEEGWATTERAAPGHVAAVRHHVVDALTPEQLDQLVAITDALLERLDPTGGMAATYRRYDG
ncbi:MarR family winged helix-turn-helix transcriptional regulator [uncultured Pseudokineococcus sp.]|uniref:MarR family winged helix-turn-helix transcriptional regulator n=1 Tax=uncultured Pseudokineococcus sp. TaxID=1642928 RepID=UPI00263626C6|nr:MarR family winged helix-turn-helix transcriptional regulator [uncultured Pseudokineococcus sp.]